MQNQNVCCTDPPLLGQVKECEMKVKEFERKLLSHSFTLNEQSLSVLGHSFITFGSFFGHFWVIFWVILGPFLGSEGPKGG